MFLVDDIFKIKNDEDFNRQALKLFHFQLNHNLVYREYHKKLNRNIPENKNWKELPFLPISFFKSHTIQTGKSNTDLIFYSSGTTGQQPSRHYISDRKIYEKSFSLSFHLFYGDPKQYTFLCLLPGYLERQGSSLIYMMTHLLKENPFAETGFYRNADDEFIKLICNLEKEKRKNVFIMGVTYSLLELCEKVNLPANNWIVMETGGMKGKRKELIREELHGTLMKALGVQQIHSEYGMTELCSQAYALDSGRYYCPPWMKIKITEIQDPFTEVMPGKSGIINVCDLANVYSAGFIQTQDIGCLHSDGSFEVLGRADHSEMRGCNLMYSSL